MTDEKTTPEEATNEAAEAKADASTENTPETEAKDA